jgi:hypothetical protein
MQFLSKPTAKAFLGRDTPFKTPPLDPFKASRRRRGYFFGCDIGLVVGNYFCARVTYVIVYYVAVIKHYFKASSNATNAAFIA